MNLTYTVKKLIDFLFNFAVVSFGVSAYEGIWYGFVVGIVCILFALVMINYSTFKE